MNRWMAAFRLTGLGFFIGICIAGGALGGWWLSGKRPVFLIIGLLVGLIVAVYGTYRMLKPLMNDKQDKEK